MADKNVPIISEDGCSLRYENRVAYPFRKKLSPIWWFGNEDDPLPPSWFQGGTLAWYIRNPLHNFTHYVIGVQDKNLTAYGSHPITVTDKKDIGEHGWVHATVRTNSTPWLPLPYLSYSGSWVNWHIGWNITGAFVFRVIKG